MSQQDESVKIRTLPRKNEKAKDETAKPAPEAKPSSSGPRWIIYVGTSSAILLAAVLLLDKPAKPAEQAGAKKIQQTEMASVAKRQNEAVSRHMQESQMHRALMVQAQMLENSKMKTKDLQADDYALDPAKHYGVQFDQEENTDRVFEDLNVNAKNFAESTPDEKINARLANRRWVNELERRERVTFVRNYIKAAYDRGYEVEINENLVVVGVKKISDKKMSIDQILNKMSKAD